MDTRYLKYIVAFLFTISCTHWAASQNNNFSITVGADFPYQNYFGLGYEFSNYQVVLRTGFMPNSYSKTISDILTHLNVDTRYTEIIDSAFDGAWMNSVGGYYVFGKSCNFHVGPELRMDQITFKQTGAELLEVLTGREVTSSLLTASSVFMNSELISIGARGGYALPIDKSKQHFLNFDLSLFKIIGVRSFITINEENQPYLNETFSQRLWDDVFKENGFFGGIGVSYKYCF